MEKVINIKTSFKGRVSSWKERVGLLLSLGKMRISLLVTVTAAEAYILAGGEMSIQMFPPLLAVFLLAFGSCALNQYQERERDGLMERTRGRPIPSGRLNPSAALGISLCLVSSGLFILFCSRDRWALALGLFALLWYNGVYTFLKGKTAFAGIPGALAGAIPPALGWISGGGQVLDPGLGAIAFFFFLWQVPHGWILQIVFEEDYRRAGLPCLPDILRGRQIKRVLYIWILSAGASCLLIPLFVFVRFPAVQAVLLAATLWLVVDATIFLRSPWNGKSFKPVFVRLNVYAFSVLLLLSLDRVLNLGAIHIDRLSRLFTAAG